MDQDNLLAEWERRAKAAGKPIGEICALAGIAASTFSRWKGGTSITFATARKFEAALSSVELDRAA